MTLLKGAIETLRAQGVTVTRASFPPEPLPGLLTVNGGELTEMQVIDYAQRQQQHLPREFAQALMDGIADGSLYVRS